MNDIWDILVKKYDISGYTDSLIIVNYEVFKELHKKAEKFDRYNLHKISLEENGVWGAINKLDAKIEAIKKHWFEEVPPFTMPFLDCQDEAVQKYIQDMTEWGREFANILEDHSCSETADKVKT